MLFTNTYIIGVINMRRLLLLVTMLVTVTTSAQIKDFFKYSTIYGTAIINQPVQDPYGDWFIPRDWTIQPQPIQNQNEYNYNYSLGIRKIARFKYENRPSIFYDGTEKNISTSTNIGAVSGWEYLFHSELARQIEQTYVNNNYFLRHLGKHHIVKVERFDNTFVNLNYSAADVRYRQSIGSKFNLSFGVNFRDHMYYGIAPIKFYLDDGGSWLALAYEAGYQDYSVDVEYNDGTSYTEYHWMNDGGDTIALSDWEFRRLKWDEIAGDFNSMMLDSIGILGTFTPVIGLDFYHRTEELWVHVWGSVLPYNLHIYGNPDYFYGVDNGYWVDYQIGLVSGVWLTKKLGIYLEVSNQRFWDRELYSVKAGLNYQFK